MEVTLKLSENHRRDLLEGLGDMTRTSLAENERLQMTRHLRSGTLNEKSLKLLQTIDSDIRRIPVHRLLEDGQVILPTPPIPERSPELEERIARLRKEQENKEYEVMTRNVAPHVLSAQDPLGARDSICGFGQEMRTVNKHVTVVVNTVLTVAGAFFFAYKASAYLVAGGDVAVQVISGLITATVVLLADMYFIAKTLIQDDKTDK